MCLTLFAKALRQTSLTAPKDLNVGSQKQYVRVQGGYRGCFVHLRVAPPLALTLMRKVAASVSARCRLVHPRGATTGIDDVDIGRIVHI